MEVLRNDDDDDDDDDDDGEERLWYDVADVKAIITHSCSEELM